MFLSKNKFYLIFLQSTYNKKIDFYHLSCNFLLSLQIKLIFYDKQV